MTDPWAVLGWLLVVVLLFALALTIVGGVLALRQQRRLNKRIERMRGEVRRGVRR